MSSDKALNRTIPKVFDLTKEPDIDHDLAVQEKLDYIADLLEVALNLEYLTCK